MPLIKLFLLSTIVLFGLGSPSGSIPEKPVAKATSVSKQEFFSYIRCHRQAKNIVINWGISSLAGVNKFVVYHSDDNGDFYSPLPDEIFPDGSLKYSYKHESVFGGYHYYYVAAVMNAGPPINSPVDIVRIVAH